MTTVLNASSQNINITSEMIGRYFKIKHDSGFVGYTVGKLIRIIPPKSRSHTHYEFKNLMTGRTFILKSTNDIKKLLPLEGENDLPQLITVMVEAKKRHRAEVDLWIAGKIESMPNPDEIYRQVKTDLQVG